MPRRKEVSSVVVGGQRSQAITDEVAVIDVGRCFSGDSGALEAVAQQIHKACTEIGFFYIVNHGSSEPVVQRAFKAMENFFALPASEKSKVRMNEHQAGWQASNVAIHGDSFDKVVKPQATEAFKFGAELEPTDPDFRGSKRFRGHNQWPEALLAEDKQALLAYHAHFNDIAKRLLAPVAVALGAAADFFDDAFRRTDSVMRCAYYPVVQPEENQFGLPGHTDLSFLTLIPPATAPGLQILTAAGTWIDQPLVEDGILVNTGDTLRTWSNDQFIATPHRVLASTRENRYSAIFFLYPDLDATISCVPTCSNADHPKQYMDRMFSDFYAGYAARNFGYAEKKE
ncbi:isopenicillin N synthase family dioxygenase [Paraburkholderia strydomiana]|uniref:isopenicillin N synthase family dioxygenase n=1 Tax=Paraburkholderia strydomiana TaxID=1245417 RepID=UPI00285C9A6B|nr:2-oxoglutarate and iron-dependent oxygenase domain-containing protein [Paraburkholderia strydomiana]MDR7009653.1 isopenicillin N synthase-like dioxygenase [Paraburkholderia strydomiana]